MVLSNRWASLKSFDIEKTAFVQGLFLKFLDAHSTTLTRISLKDCDALDSSTRYRDGVHEHIPDVNGWKVIMATLLHMHETKSLQRAQVEISGWFLSSSRNEEFRQLVQDMARDTAGIAKGSTLDDSLGRRRIHQLNIIA
jgi:hypothetical protein